MVALLRKVAPVVWLLTLVVKRLAFIVGVKTRIMIVNIRIIIIITVVLVA